MTIKRRSRAHGCNSIGRDAKRRDCGGPMGSLAATQGKGSTDGRCWNGEAFSFESLHLP